MPTKKPTRTRRKRRRTGPRPIWRWARRIVSGLLLFSVALILLLRWVNPPITYLMAREWQRLGAIEHQWVPIEAMSPHLALSAAAAEDAHFCAHPGIDFDAVRKAWREGEGRGGSTISQQVAKNVFLWPGRSWLRKGLEAGFTLMIEALWPKRRIIEVYLNVAEFDEGVFGVSAASHRYFSTSPDKITAAQAARLMAILPSPRTRSAARPTEYIASRAAQITIGAETLLAEGRAACIIE